MSRLTRDGTAEPVSRDQILRREQRQRNIHFSCSVTTSRIGNLAWLILTLAICDDHTYIHTRKVLCLPNRPGIVTLLLSTCPLHTNSGWGKERRLLICPWSPAKAAPVWNYLEVYRNFADGLSAVNAIGTQLRDPIDSGQIRWRMAVEINSGRRRGTREESRK